MPPRPGTTRRERYLEAARLKDAGCSSREIAAEMGISFSHVRALLADPTGEKDRRRKESYRKPCPRCGTLMSGSDGPNSPKSPSVCQECAKTVYSNRIWTQETIISAIQEWAMEHGRPPVAMEWASSSGDGRYPPLGAVYRHGGKSRGGRHQPFASWADAIEAAGFPRPKIGRKVRPFEQGARGVKTTYVVLHQEESGLWSLTEVDGARTPESAIESIAARPGKYVAVRKSIFVEREVGRVSKYAVLPSTPGGA